MIDAVTGHPEDTPPAQYQGNGAAPTGGNTAVAEKTSHFLATPHAQRAKSITRPDVAYRQRKSETVYIKKSNVLSSAISSGNIPGRYR